MRMEHGDVLNTVGSHLENTGVSLNDVLSLDSPILKKALKMFQLKGVSVATTSKLLFCLRRKGYMPFYDVRLLEILIDKFDDGQCRQALNMYIKKHLQPYLLRCKSNTSGPNGLIRLIIKVDRHWDMMSELDEREVTEKLASIVDVPHEKLVVECHMITPENEQKDNNATNTEIEVHASTAAAENCPTSDRTDCSKLSLSKETGAGHVT